MENKEEWKIYPSDTRYLVSNLGGVRMGNNPLRKPSWTPKGYAVIVVVKDHKKIGYYIHRMVMETFIGKCPCGYTVSHINGNPADNRITNLCYETLSKNDQRKIYHGTDSNGEHSVSAKLSWKDVDAIRNSKISQNKLAKEYNVSRITIQRVVHGVCWKPEKRVLQEAYSQ